MAALTGRSSLTGLRGSLHLNKQPRFHASKRLVTVRADNDSKVVREYREDEDKVVVPGSSGVEQRADGLYVDSTSRPALKPQDNMSREMKARLRKEYLGLGGAEGQAMGSNYFLWIIAVISVLAVLSKLTGAI